MEYLSFCGNVVTEQQSVDWNIWVPAIIGIFTLFLNIIFSIFVAPRIISQYQRKDKMFDICAEFMDYLSEIVSMESFDGVPTKVRNYCLKIHIMFNTGTAPDLLSKKMEDIFQNIKKRKTLQSNSDISTWESEFRMDARELRRLLSKYTGLFRK